MTGEGPLKSAFESDTTGVVKQEFITYRSRDGVFVKEVTSRIFTKGDYYDSHTVMPLIKFNEET